jgi:hypothetical protein
VGSRSELRASDAASISPERRWEYEPSRRGRGDGSPVPHPRLRRQPERRITARDTALTNRSAD